MKSLIWSWTGRLNIGKLSISAPAGKVLMEFSPKFQQDSKLSWKCKGIRIIKAILKNKDKIRRTIPLVKIYYMTVVIKTVPYWQSPHR